jgi:hypothetical protein
MTKTTPPISNRRVRIDPSPLAPIALSKTVEQRCAALKLLPETPILREAMLHGTACFGDGIVQRPSLHSKNRLTIDGW